VNYYLCRFPNEVENLLFLFGFYTKRLKIRNHNSKDRQHHG